jgi:hypothetical protein
LTGCLANPITLAVAPGFKSVKLEPAVGDLADCGLNDRELAFAAFPSAFLNPRKGSLGTCAILEFPTVKRVFDVDVVIVWPEICKFVSQQSVDDLFQR